MTALLLTAWATSTGLLISCRAPAPRCCATDGAAASFRQRLREVNVDPALLSEVTTIVAHKSGVASRHKRPDGPMGQYELRAGLPLDKPFGTKPRFIASAAIASSMPPEGYPEVAFIGRSNVGKSSLLNALTGVSALAKVSDKPGKTQKLNFFELGRRDETFNLVDMPGYGFAFASDEAVQRWGDLSAEYLTTRKTLKLVLVLLDAKVGLKPTDLQMLQFLEANRIKYTIVLTKADAAGAPNRAAQLAALTLASVKRARHFVRPAAIVSARTGAGVGRLQRRIIETATGKDPLVHLDGGWNAAAASGPQPARRGGRGGRGAGRGAATASGRGGERGGSGRGGGRGGRGGRRGRGSGRGDGRGSQGRRARVRQ